MANLGTGFISVVSSYSGLDLLPQVQVPIIGEKSFFQVSMFDKQLKIKPIIIGIGGKQASILEPVITNRFKAR